MATTLFDRSLFVRHSRYIEEIASLQDAFDLLEKWPEDQLGLPHEVLVDACHAAAVGTFPLSALRENLERFLKRAGRLAEVGNMPGSADQRPGTLPSIVA